MAIHHVCPFCSLYYRRFLLGVNYSKKNPRIDINKDSETTLQSESKVSDIPDNSAIGTETNDSIDAKIGLDNHE